MQASKSKNQDLKVMKKWEQLQLTLDNSKSEEGQGNYKDKTQNLFKTVRVQII